MRPEGNLGLPVPRWAGLAGWWPLSPAGTSPPGSPGWAGPAGWWPLSRAGTRSSGTRSVPLVTRVQGPAGHCRMEAKQACPARIRVKLAVHLFPHFLPDLPFSKIQAQHILRGWSPAVLGEVHGHGGRRSFKGTGWSSLRKWAPGGQDAGAGLGLSREPVFFTWRREGRGSPPGEGTAAIPISVPTGSPRKEHEMAGCWKT